jgi:7-cyano-7-deazaguanine tRNA-ribosyltransferase
MMFALAVAAGCDLFDSAAYALYARDGRYLTVRGTESLADLSSFPCSCPVCAGRTPAELRERGSEERTRLLAEHNLHVSFEELRRVREAIRSGDLFELVEARARAHPSMADGYRTLLDHAGTLERTDPVSKGTFFHLSAESAHRPEVDRHHDRLDRLAVPDGRVLLTTGSGNSDAYDATWRVVPPFGPFPRALSESYPLTAETPARLSAIACRRAAEGVARLAAQNPDTRFTLAHDGWPARATEPLAGTDVRLVVRGAGGGPDEDVDGDER